MPAEDVHAALDRLQTALGVRLVIRHHRFTGLTVAGRRFATIAEVAAELVSAGATHIGATDIMRNSLAVPCGTPEPPAQRVSRRRARAGTMARLTEASRVGFSRAAE